MNISLCMILKNEAELLPWCLESVQHLVDEIIVVDTGSTDGTPSVAQNYGAKVFHSEWTGDFSKHRNEAFAEATGDWYFVMDADNELVTQVTKDALHEQLQGLPDEASAVAFAIKDVSQQGQVQNHRQQIRLFRADRNPRYEGMIHNQPKFEGRAVGSDITLHHYGFDLTKEKMEQKYHRTKTKLMERIDADEEDFEAWYYLANLENSLGNRQVGIENAKKCIQCLPDEPLPIYLTIYFAISMALIDFKKYEEASQYLQEGLKALPDDPDLHYALYRYGVETGEKEAILDGGRKYLEVIPEYRDKPSQDFRFTHTTDPKHEYDVRRGIYAVLTDVEFETLEA